MKTYLLPAVRLLAALSLITGVAYPLAMTFFASAVFNGQANGSMIEHNGETIGSSLIGQKFTSPAYFHSRPSAVDYNPLPSSGSNLGPTSTALRDSARARRRAFAAENNLHPHTLVPQEMCFTSGSGLDPDISPRAASLQVERIARTRGYTMDQSNALANLVNRSVDYPVWGFLGEARINVLRLNIAMDDLIGK